MNPGAATPTPPWRRRSTVLFTLGVALLALAVWSASRTGQSGGGLPDAWASVRGAPPWLLGAAVALPILNWLLTSAVFWVLTRRYGDVGAGEMASLIGAAWLTNYIPMRPGLFGRVAYHKAVNKIAIADSVRVLAWSIGAGLGATLMVLVCGVLLEPSAPTPRVVMVLGAPLAAFALVALASGRRSPGGWRLPTAVLLRYADVLVWTARYLVVFALIGRPIELAQAAAVAGVSQLVLVIPLAGNGLGLREWAVGWAAASLPAWYAAGPASGGVTVGVTADLVNRLAEVVVAVAVGTLCIGAVARRLARIGRDKSGQARPSNTTA